MINLLLMINKQIERANDLAGYIGRNLSIFAMGLMANFFIVSLTDYFQFIFETISGIK